MTMPQLTVEILTAGTGCTAARATTWLPHIQQACARFGIDTPARVAAFLAQIGHESGRLVYTRELWGPTPAQATYERDFTAPWVRYVGGLRHRNTKAFDLGNSRAGDGRCFLGRGLIQTTGRANYAATRDGLRRQSIDAPDFEATPARLEAPEWAALSAAWYWYDRELNTLADMGYFETLTRRINGGTNGLADRMVLWTKAKTAMGVV